MDSPGGDKSGTGPWTMANKVRREEHSNQEEDQKQDLEIGIHMAWSKV